MAFTIENTYIINLLETNTNNDVASYVYSYSEPYACRHNFENYR